VALAGSEAGRRRAGGRSHPIALVKRVVGTHNRRSKPRTPSLGDFYAELARRPPHRAIILGLYRKQSLGMSAQFGTPERILDAVAAASTARRAQS
jgi:hypothetical protein